MKTTSKIANKEQKIRYNRSEILKRAWYLWRFKNEENKTWKEICSISWKIAKENHSSIDFNSIYNKYKKDVLNFILFKTNHDYDLSQDFLNITFTNAYNNFFSYDSTKSQIKTWLFNIAKNLIISYYNSKSVREKAINVSNLVNHETGKEFFTMPDKSNNIEKDIENKIISEKLNLAINNLNCSYKEVIEKYLLEDLSYVEIAEKLNIPLGTVKASINRSKKQLQGSLKEYEKEYNQAKREVKTANKKNSKFYYEVENDSLYY